MLGYNQAYVLYLLALNHGTVPSRHYLRRYYDAETYNDRIYRTCRSLARRGLIAYSPRGPVTLTEQGRVALQRKIKEVS